MTLTEKYKEKITGVLSCYDRVIITGTLPTLCYAEGMTSYMKSKNLLIFDYARFAEPYRNSIRENAEKIAAENGIEIEFVRKQHIRKEDIIAEKLKKRGWHCGLVHILSAMETCHTYKPWHDKKSGKTYLRNETSKCLHYYFYFIDEILGLCYVRVPTWCPFGLQIYFNGHNWLAHQLTKQSIAYTMLDNAFDSIADFARAQHIADSFDIKQLHQRLDYFAATYCPVSREFERVYHWSIAQIEYATDIVFKKQEDLQAIYSDLMKTAIHTVTPDSIATFLGKKLHGNFQGEMGNNYAVRIEGRRVKHQMESATIKMYDKVSKILRIETTTHRVSFFKHYREVEHRNGEREKQVAQFKKSIYSLAPLREVLAAVNHRYLAFISQIETREVGRAHLNAVSHSITENNRHYKGFNFFDDDDLKLLRILMRGEYCINGFKNKTLRAYFPDKNTGHISRLLKRLKIHGFIKKVRRSYKYYLTSFGQYVISTALKIKELFIIPELNVFATQ